MNEESKQVGDEVEAIETARIDCIGSTPVMIHVDKQDEISENEVAAKPPVPDLLDSASESVESSVGEMMEESVEEKKFFADSQHVAQIPASRTPAATILMPDAAGIDKVIGNSGELLDQDATTIAITRNIIDGETKCIDSSVSPVSNEYARDCGERSASQPASDTEPLCTKFDGESINDTIVQDPRTVSKAKLRQSATTYTYDVNVNENASLQNGSESQSMSVPSQLLDVAFDEQSTKDEPLLSSKDSENEYKVTQPGLDNNLSEPEMDSVAVSGVDSGVTYQQVGLDNDCCRDDINSNAAEAMAAVAAAASVNAISPSAAAEAARAIAPNLVPEAISGGNKDISTVSLPRVKEHLARALSGPGKVNPDLRDDNEKGLAEILQTRLSRGENDHFLQHLLLLQYFRTEPVNDGMAPAAEQEEPIRSEIESTEQRRALSSAQQVRSILHMAEEAYDSMAALLPSLLEDEQINSNDGDSEYYGIDAPVVVPDLLPPCTSEAGDATLQFFLACKGETQHEGQESGESIGELESDKNGEPIQKDSIGGEKDGQLPPDGAEAAVKSAASVFTSMFSSMTRSAAAAPARPASTFSGVFRKRTRPNEPELDRSDVSKASGDEELANGEYSVSIDREMLGLTVENVLERTVVRTVLPGGAAKKAGAKVGSLIVKVGNVPTRNLTHFETIDELRQSQRPLKLVLRQITSDALRAAREEMGRLIRGGGFGSSLPLEHNDLADLGRRSISASFRRTHHGKPANVEAFSQVLHQRWNRHGVSHHSLKEEALIHASEKLVWILTLLAIGLEREAAKVPKSCSRDSPGRRPHNSHMSEDYGDAAKSVSKVLYDFVSSRLLVGEDPAGDKTKSGDGSNLGNPANRFRRGPPQPPLSTQSGGRGGGRVRLQDASNPSQMNNSQNLLYRIGDVLHRTRSFLADPNSPPAALLRGEVISFLCDILDIDTEMELSEEEAGSSTAGLNSAPINDLGSAGSLLKLIILNCSIMRSPGCTSMTRTTHSSVPDLEEEQRRRFGLKQNSSRLDLHRFHAGNRFLAVVHRLAASRSISARVTACSLGPVLWGHLDFPHQLQLRGVITRALHDVDVIVRKSTATVLHEIAELVFDPRAVPWLVLMCERTMTDPEPQLRSAAMTLTWHLSEHLPNAFLGDASQGSRSLRRLPSRSDPTFAEVYLLQCKLLPVATRLAEDRAPSVRLAVAAQCDRLCNALGEHWYSVIIDVLQALLSDTDENVRSEAILCAPRLTEIVLVTATLERARVGVLEALLPVSMKLISDPSPNVRIALATAAGDLLTLLVGLESIHEISPPSAVDHLLETAENARTNKKHVDDTLIPLLQKLLQDPEPEVTSAALRAVTNASRGNVREIRGRQNSRTADDDTLSLSSYQSHTSLEKKDPVFIPVLSEEQVMRLMPTLSELANNRQWRVRQGAVEIVPALLGCTKKLGIRSEVAQLCFQLMNDRVHAVRKTAAECLCLSGGGLGSHGEESAGEWTRNVVIPHIRSCSQSRDSKQRILSLMMIEIIVANGICPRKKKFSRSESLEDDRCVPPQLDLINIAVSLASDKVANVRLNFGRMSCGVVSNVDDEELALLANALQKQVDHERTQERGGDRDVLFFALKAMSHMAEKD